MNLHQWSLWKYSQISISQEPVLRSLSYYWSKAALRAAGPALGCVAATQLGTWLLAQGQRVSPGPSATSKWLGSAGEVSVLPVPC